MEHGTVIIQISIWPKMLYQFKREKNCSNIWIQLFHLILVQSKANKKGYGCTNILIVVFLIELKGDNVHQIALNLKIVLFLFITMKVCKVQKEHQVKLKLWTIINYVTYCHCSIQPWIQHLYFDSLLQMKLNSPFKTLFIDF